MFWGNPAGLLSPTSAQIYWSPPHHRHIARLSSSDRGWLQNILPESYIRYPTGVCMQPATGSKIHDLLTSPSSAAQAVR
jgi:hypothetical protein